MRGFPALLGRGGRFRQAIPGLSKTASASLPRPRLRAANPPRPARLGAARRGGTSKAESEASQKQLVIPAQAGIQLWPYTPQPPLTLRPLPQGERGPRAGSRRLLTLPLMLPCCGRSPRPAAPSIAACGEQARAQTRVKAGSRRFHPQAMDGLWVKPAAGEKRREPSNRFLIGRRRLRGGPSLVTFLWLLTRK